MDLNIKLTKPYVFEDNTYTEIDLTALENLNTNQLVEAERRFERGGGVSTLKEFDMKYACIVSSIATNKPVEFFLNLPARDGINLKNKVSAFFYSGISMSGVEKN